METKLQTKKSPERPKVKTTLSGPEVPISLLKKKEYGPFVGEITPLKSKSWEGNFLQLLSGQNELKFYEDIFDSKWDSSNQTIARIRGLIPRYYGTVASKFGDKEMTYLRLEDLCLKFEKPRWLELVLAPKEPKNTLGFYVKQANEIRDSKRIKITEKMKPGPHYEQKEIEQALSSFLTCNGCKDDLIIQGLVHRLNHVRALAETQNRFRFREFRLLIIYDAEAHGMSKLSSPPMGGRDLGAMLDMTDLRMTYFGDVTPSQSQDKEFLSAVTSLSNVLKQMLPPQTP